MSIEQLFAGFEGAEVFGKGQFFGADFEGLVRPVLIKANTAGFNGASFVVELEIVQSNGKRDASGNEIDPVGAKRSWVVMMNPTNKNAFGDIKGFVLALLGYDPSKAGKPQDHPELHRQAGIAVKAACDEAFARSQGIDPRMFLGRLVALSTFVKATKPKVPGGPAGQFTVHKWSPAPQQ